VRNDIDRVSVSFQIGKNIKFQATGKGVSIALSRNDRDADET
jgi:hypothetical protein